ncbi:MAG: hypothetical protein HQ500_02405 [Flavobacteriales bacterium]|nr:hypothetical protein [Flavobacteriales bacterium]
MISLGQDTTHYVRIGNLSKEAAVGMVPEGDSTFIILLNSGSEDESLSSNFHLLRISEGGNVLEAHSYGTNAVDRAIDFFVTQETIIVCGLTNGHNNALYEAFIYFIDRNDHSISKEYYFNIDEQWTMASALTVDGDSVIVIIETIGEEKEVELIHFDLQGTFISKSLNPLLQGFKAYAITPRVVGSKGFLVVASRIGDSLDAHVLYLDKNFDVEWDASFSLSGDEEFFEAVEVSDSSIIAVGYSNSFFGTDEDILIVQFDSLGMPLDTLLQGYDVTVNNKDDRATSITTRNDSLFLTGYTSTYGEGGVECFTTVLSPSLGLTNFSTTFGTQDNEWSEKIQLHKSGAVGIGQTQHQAQGSQDLLFWYREHFTNNMVETVITSEYYFPESTQVGIEAVNAQTELRNSADLSELSRVKIFDLNGKVILEVDGSQWLEERSTLKGGMYMALGYDRNERPVMAQKVLIVP